MTSAPLCVGVDGCRGGWLAVLLAADETARMAVFGHFSALADAVPHDAVIAVDMPIGLPERIGAGGRGPERAVRPLLGARQSSVFSIPARPAVYAEDYGEACRLAQATSDPPKKVSRQAFHIFAKIRELDGFLRAHPARAAVVFEAHPELAFWRLNGERAMALAKKIKGRVNPAGIEERRALLVACGYADALVGAPAPRGAGRDDVLDAAALALIARRRARGEAEPFAPSPMQDAYGLPIAIWA